MFLRLSVDRKCSASMFVPAQPEVLFLDARALPDVVAVPRSFQLYRKYSTCPA